MISSTALPMVIIWGVAAVIFLIVEGVTAGLASIWFVIGSAAALIAALLHAPLWLQFVLFIVISVICLAATRPLAKKYINSRTQPTNLDSIIGKSCPVTEMIDNLNETGAIKIDGKVWTARSMSGDCIPVGTIVRIEKIEGVKLIVMPET